MVLWLPLTLLLEAMELESPFGAPARKLRLKASWEGKNWGGPAFVRKTLGPLFPIWYAFSGKALLSIHQVSAIVTNTLGLLMWLVSFRTLCIDLRTVWP